MEKNTPKGEGFAEYNFFVKEAINLNFFIVKKIHPVVLTRSLY